MNTRSLSILALSLLLPIAAACSGESFTENAGSGPQDAGIEAAAEASAPDAADDTVGQDAAVAEAAVEGSSEAAIAQDAAKDCVAAFSAEIAPVIEDLLYMSESDYPFEVFSYPDDGIGEISPSHVLDLLGLPADTAVEQRTPEQFFTEYLMTGPDGAKYAQMKSILEANMSDLTVIRIGAIEIDVFVVGRTECGEIAGLKTTAIET